MIEATYVGNVSPRVSGVWSTTYREMAMRCRRSAEPQADNTTMENVSVSCLNILASDSVSISPSSGRRAGSTVRKMNRTVGTRETAS